MELPKKQGPSGARRAFRAVALLLPLLCVLPAWADSEGDASASATDSPELRRELAGHNFIPSRFSLDPFVSTYVASETGFGYGTASGHVFDIAGNPVSLANYEVGAYAQLIDYQYGFLPWWAVRADVELIVYSGVNGSGAAAVGTNAFGRGGLGTTVSFKLGDNVRLGGSLDFTIGPSVFFNILKSVQDSIDSGNVVSPITSAGSYSLQPAFVGAWAIQKWVGLTFSLAYLYTNATSTNSAGNTTNSTNTLASNGVFDFDLKPACGVPIGFLLGFQTQFSVDSTSFRQFRYQTGIFYTDVKPLNVGLEIIYQRAPVIGATQIFVSSVQALITIQYNFN
ncbi:MAG: hypothetical protein ACLQIH_15155 [Myxococcaceae bacterium]